MKAFPAVADLLGGAHFPVVEGERLRFGMAKECDVKLTVANAAPRHCEVFVEFGRWWLRDLGSLTGTWFLGERINDVELVDGDAFVIGNTRYQLQLQPPRAPRNEVMEARARTDPAALQVYSDWLAERGVEMGARMPDAMPRDRLRSLRALSPDVASGHLELEWRDGFVRRALLRRFDLRTEPDFAWVLEQIASHEAFGLLEVLQVEPELVSSVELARLLNLPSARSPSFPGVRIEVTQPVLLSLRIEAEDEVRAVPLTERQRNSGEVAAVEQTEGERLLVPGPVDLLFELHRTWRVNARRAIRVNGISTDQASLRAGDVIELGPRHRITVEARRLQLF